MQTAVAGLQQAPVGTGGQRPGTQTWLGITVPPEYVQTTGSSITHLSQQQQASIGPVHWVMKHAMFGEKLPLKSVHCVCVVLMHELFGGMQQAPNTNCAQFTLTHVLPTPKNPPPFGMHSHEYVTTQLMALKQHAPKPHGVLGGWGCGHGFGLQVVPKSTFHPFGQGAPTDCKQLPVTGSQQAYEATHGLGLHVVLGS